MTTKNALYSAEFWFESGTETMIFSGMRPWSLIGRIPILDASCQAIFCFYGNQKLQDFKEAVLYPVWKAT